MEAVNHEFKINLEQLRRDVVFACKILVYCKLDSGPFGNVSIRVPGTNEYCLNPAGILFDELSPKDILHINTDGQVLEGKHHPHPGEFIHREIYKLRPDVGAIVHTHSENTVGISLLGLVIEPYTQIGAASYKDQGIYEAFSGPVRSSCEGAAIASALGKNSLVIAKNHGLFAVGNRIYNALWDMVLADMAAAIHLKALQMAIPKAEKPAPEVVNKSKQEVRIQQAEIMWKSYLRNLS